MAHNGVVSELVLPSKSALAGYFDSRSFARGERITRDVRSATAAEADDEITITATVMGTRAYRTVVTIAATKHRTAVVTQCSCPVARQCKHGVAVAIVYLSAHWAADAHRAPGPAGHPDGPGAPGDAAAHPGADAAGAHSGSPAAGAAGTGRPGAAGTAHLGVAAPAAPGPGHPGAASPAAPGSSNTAPGAPGRGRGLSSKPLHAAQADSRQMKQHPPVPYNRLI